MTCPELRPILAPHSLSPYLPGWLPPGCCNAEWYLEQFSGGSVLTGGGSKWHLPITGANTEPFDSDLSGPAKDPFVNSDFPQKTRQRSGNDSDVQKLLLSVTVICLLWPTTPQAAQYFTVAGTTLFAGHLFGNLQHSIKRSWKNRKIKTMDALFPI